MERINLLPPNKKRLNRLLEELRITAFVVGVAAIIGIGAWGWLVYLSQQSAKRLEASQIKLDETNRQIASFGDIQKKITIINQRLKKSKQLAVNLVDWQKVLEELANVTPATVKLTSVNSGEAKSAPPTSGPTLENAPNNTGEKQPPPEQPTQATVASWQIQGQAENDRQLLIYQKTLEDSPVFANVSVVSKNKQTAEQGEKLTFSMKFSLEEPQNQ